MERLFFPRGWLFGLSSTEHDTQPAHGRVHKRTEPRISANGSDDCSQLNIDDGAAGLNSGVDSRQRTPAETTAAIISKATQTGASLSIPGSLEARVGRAARRAPDATSATGSEPPAEKDGGMASDRERREYQLAGGGAPSERGITRRESVIERLCQLLRWRPGRREEPPSISNSVPLASLPGPTYLQRPR